MLKLSVMDNTEISCWVLTIIIMPVMSSHDLQNCSSPDSQYKSLEKKKERLKLHHLIKIPRWNGKLVCLKKNYFHKSKNWFTGMVILL